MGLANGSEDPQPMFLQKLVNLPVFPVFIFYLTVTLSWGSWKKRLPTFELKGVLLIHNLLCSVISGVTMCMFTYEIVRLGTVVEMSQSRGLTNAFDLYWLTKVVELMDTGFMMLRNKGRQISFLHVYHHSAMLLLSDYARRYSAWPPMGVLLGMNSFVHIFLYGYYFVSVRQKVDQRAKKWLTQLQILQFLIAITFCTYGYVFHRFCRWSILFAFSMLAMFGHFYYRAYCVPPKASWLSGAAPSGNEAAKKTQ